MDIITELTATEPEAVARLTRDQIKAAQSMSVDQARFLVDNYYIHQKGRIRAAHQCRSLGEGGEPHELLEWFNTQSGSMEKRLTSVLLAYAKSKDLGEWAMSICGIGPIIAAGLLAHIDCTKPTVGHVWAFAGLDPTKEWKKGQKRPHNASLKTLCWKIGESFVKVSGRETDIYGHLYLERKAMEAAKNEAGDYEDQAAAKLEKFKIGKDTEAYGHYSSGRLPPAHINARAKRWAVKMFLSHYWAVGHYLETDSIGPLPWVIENGGHIHLREPPNMGLIEGLAEAWADRVAD
jgi:hypothetical protein